MDTTNMMVLFGILSRCNAAIGDDSIPKDAALRDIRALAFNAYAREKRIHDIRQESTNSKGGR